MSKDKFQFGHLKDKTMDVIDLSDDISIDLQDMKANADAVLVKVNVDVLNGLYTSEVEKLFTLYKYVIVDMSASTNHVPRRTVSQLRLRYMMGKGIDFNSNTLRRLVVQDEVVFELETFEEFEYVFELIQSGRMFNNARIRPLIVFKVKGDVDKMEKILDEMNPLASFRYEVVDLSTGKSKRNKSRKNQDAIEEKKKEELEKTKKEAEKAAKEHQSKLKGDDEEKTMTEDEYKQALKDNNPDKLEEEIEAQAKDITDADNVKVYDQEGKVAKEGKVTKKKSKKRSK